MTILRSALFAGLLVLLTNTSYPFAVTDTNLFAGAAGTGWVTTDGVILSADNNTSWIDPDLTDSDELELRGTDLLAWGSSGLWRHPLLETLTSVQEIPDKIPRSPASSRTTQSVQT